MKSIEINNSYQVQKKLHAEEKKLEKKHQSSLAARTKIKRWKNAKPLSSTKVKKPKKPSRSKLVRKLDSIFSRYIRLINADKDGMVVCTTSGERIHRKNIQNGHYISRWNYKYRRDEKNCHPQSYVDNVLKNWNYKVYTMVMIRKYGELLVEEMINDKELIKIPTSWIIEKIEYYTKLVEEIAATKKLEL